MKISNNKKSPTECTCQNQLFTKDKYPTVFLEIPYMLMSVPKKDTLFALNNKCNLKGLKLPG